MEFVLAVVSSCRRDPEELFLTPQTFLSLWEEALKKVTRDKGPQEAIQDDRFMCSKINDLIAMS